MPIINNIELKTARGRLAIGLLYFILTLGGISMVYPFLLMLSISVSNEADNKTTRFWPSYLTDTDALFKKYVATKYSGFQRYLGARHLNRHYLGNYYRFEDFGSPQVHITTIRANPDGSHAEVPVNLSEPEQLRRARDWHAFLATLPSTHVTRSCEAWLVDRYRDWLKERFRNNLAALRETYGETATHWTQIDLPFHDPYRREWQPGTDAKSREWSEFWKAQPLSFRLPVRMDGVYQDFLKQRMGAVETINALAQTQYRSLTEVRLGRTVPANPRLGAWWIEFVRKRIPHPFLDVSAATASFHAWLDQKYHGDLQRLNQQYGAAYRTFHEVPFENRKPERAGADSDWSQFITTAIAAHEVRLDTVETRWSDWLRMTYHDDLARVNQLHGLAARAFDEVRLPFAEGDRLFVEQQTKRLRVRYLFGNYATVLAHLLVHGRAFWNTAALCLAMVLAQLTVNPFCAYALSRFPLSYKYKILLFLIATMTFPAEVLMIPNFLLLKQLRLLDTYAALILPGLVSGYYIFLMKGFFDSLPRELFEAAEIEGAGELRMFFQIAYPLSKPIFAVKALGAFMAAYGGFMWAFLVCQDPDMWTVMVHLYQFQIEQPPHLVMAALTLASIPTLLVFLFCQRIILRGIVLPTLK
ncbi:MAG: carbohydrate ABC transporter permease [Verrucomicrobia bacterium]|nr:carbohydrate ABC transporter permease [Verrucomicrobiota bacterium]